MPKLFMLPLAVLALFFISSASAGKLVIGTGENSYLLGPAIDILEDPGAELKFSEILMDKAAKDFVPLTGDFPNFGFTNSAYWYRFTIENQGDQLRNMRLAVDCSWIDSMILYSPVSDGSYKEATSGNTLPFHQRETEHRLFVNELQLPPGEVTFYMRVQTRDPFMTPITLWEPAAFAQNDLKLAYYYGMFYGVLIVIFLYNAFVYLALKDRRYIYYCLYIISFFLMNFSYNGFAYQHWWPEQPVWDNWSHSIFIYLFEATGLLFAIVFLDTRRVLPRLHKLLIAFLFFLLVSFLSSALIGGYALNVMLSIYLVNLYAGLVALAGILALIAGYRAARFFVLASIASLIGASLTSLTVSGVLPYSFALYHAAEFGVLIDVILLSLALADRINILRVEKAHAQHYALEQETKMQLALEQANEELERKVKRRTMELMEAKNRAEELARTDALTGVSNRLAFNEQAEHEFAKAKRYAEPLTLVLFDLDLFKRINDEYGHAAGDAVIQSSARIAGQSIRQADMLGRLGGEEFAILLPNTSERMAWNNAERLREAMARALIAYDGHKLSYTASFGITQYRESDATFDAMMLRVDALLYEAKRDGRNCVRPMLDNNQV